MELSGSRRPNVMVMHAEPLLAVGLVAALRPRADLHLVDGDDACDLQMDVVVTDYDSGLRLAEQARNRQLPRRLAEARVLVIALSAREEEVRTALAGGIHGFLLIGCPIEELVNGVHTLARGSRFLCMGAAQRMADMLTRESLTAREAEVLHLVALGACNKSIARELEIAVGTVKAHVKAIMGKLDASSRTQAASIAAARGLVQAEQVNRSTLNPSALPTRFAGRREQYA